jgi:predicted small metal-binding protein
MDLQTANRTASEAAARIDAEIKTRLVKHARKHGMTEAEGMDLAEAWKQASVVTERLHLGPGRHKAH